ncbi:MAG TPA: exodeoxyribonuclease VII large subunit, partial [Prosthecobacter sp.]
MSSSLDLRSDSQAEGQVLSVTELTREIREVLEGRIGTVWVEGEISNHRLQSSGHQYFTLKDAGSQLSCVMFRGAARSSVRLADGAQVQVQGEITVYELRGQYQMVVRQVQMRGQGGLQARFEALKRKLYDEGLFAPEAKKSIPKFPRTVALVTSPTGAAIQDMLNILTRRAPWLQVVVYPVRVQGTGVERETIRALEVLNAAQDHGLPVPDTIVIGRGGGSIEDLWAYNEETLARAIYASRIPVISAVGHEIDFTIADFVADLRAPTPSAAAELLAPDVAELRRHLDVAGRRLGQLVEARLSSHEQ